MAPRKKAAVSEQAPAQNRRKPHDARDAENVKAFAKQVYDLTVLIHNNLVDAEALLRRCSSGTTIRPETSNMMKRLNAVVAASAEFTNKAAKECSKQGKNPVP